MAIDIAQLLKVVQTQDTSVKRQAFKPEDWDMKNLLQCWEQIGKLYEPNYVIDADNKFCIVNLIRWIISDPDFQCINPVSGKRVRGNLKAGLYIYGNTGSGKTLATRIMGQLCYALGIRIQFRGEIKPLSWRSYRSDELTDRAMRGDLLEDIRNSPILCIQDLGCEPDEVVYMGNRIPVFRNIFSQRGEFETITIITSNIPLDSPDFVNKYGDRVKSRLACMCNFLTLNGGDRRIKKN